MSEGNGISLRDGLYGFEYREEDRRRVDSSERKIYNIKQMWQRTHEIVNLAAQGFKQTEIAEILNIHPQTVSNTLGGDLAKHKLSEIRYERDEEVKKVVEKIRVLSDKALNVYHEIFDNEGEQLNLKDQGEFAHKFLSDFSGLKAPTKIQAHHISTVLTKEELEEFKNRAKKAAEQSGIPMEKFNESEAEATGD